MSGFTTRRGHTLVVLAALLALGLAPAPFPAEAKTRSRVVTRTFSNTAPVTLPASESDPVLADLYPSPIVVSGLKGKILDVNLTLKNLAHDYHDVIQVLLVGPGGQTAIVMAETGRNSEAEDVTLRLDDEAAELLPISGLQSGVFWPTNHLGRPLAFGAPAPQVTRANAALAIFDGRSPNGTWRLFVQDPYGGSPAGGFAGGWALEITAQVKANKTRR